MTPLGNSARALWTGGALPAPSGGPRADSRSCREMLPSVSRTFALTIRVLPPDLRESVTVAYLLCRIADMLEDATGTDPEPRIAGLETFAAALAEPGADAHSLFEATRPMEELPLDDPAGVRLLRTRGAVFNAWGALPDPDRQIVSRWVQAMASGMSIYVARELRRAAPGESGVRYVLDTTEELRAYAWYVAGTVGHLLTELFAGHLSRRGGCAFPEARLRELAAPFGLGLQFTNIVQDIAEDRRRGWSYVPEELARRHGTTVRRLDDPSEMRAALRVLGDLVGEAAGYLDRAMEYTLLLPRRAPRIRLFCLWPTFFALRTLVRLWGNEGVLTGGEKVRISRSEVRSVVGVTSAACLWNTPLERLYRAERTRLERRIAVRPV